MISADPKVQSVKQDVKETVGGQQSQVPPPPGDATSQQVPQNLKGFLTEDELDRIIDEPGLINVALERATQGFQQYIGQYVQNEVQRQLAVTKAVSDFYTVNEDLLPHARFVQYVMREIETTNPDKTYGEIFELSAKESRRRLGLSAKQPLKNSDDRKPAFAIS